MVVFLCFPRPVAPACAGVRGWISRLKQRAHPGVMNSQRPGFPDRERAYPREAVPSQGPEPRQFHRQAFNIRFRRDPPDRPWRNLADGDISGTGQTTTAIGNANLRLAVVQLE